LDIAIFYIIANKSNYFVTNLLIPTLGLQLMKLNYSYFYSLKGEFEAEGSTQQNIAAESLFAARNGLDYLVKIGGCEAKNDICYLADLGITSVVAPMIESGFAMQKYMEMLQGFSFSQIGVTIETITAVENIDEILKQGNRLTKLTIGRTDLSASFGGGSVEASRITNIVKTVAKQAKRANLKVVLGGSVSKNTLELLKGDAELRELLDFVETRKAVIPIGNFLDKDALSHAIELERVLMGRRAHESNRVLLDINNRLSCLTKRE
jgi:4-hydroxy-2-oxoheptanedioate aldolase